MKAIWTLLRLDLFRVKNWFRSYLGTKLVVMLGFLLVVTSVVAIEYFLALSFFRLTATQGQFGLAVTQYSINAALLVLFILAVLSGTASSVASLYHLDFLRFLLTLPLSQGKIFISRSISALLQSIWVILLLVTPILVAFARAFSPGPDYGLRLLTTLIILALSSQAISSLLAVLLVKRFGRLSRRSVLGLFALAIVGSLVMMRFLFPPAFFRLYYAQDWLSFQTQLGQLPLLSTGLPTNWLASTLTLGWSVQSLWAVLLTLGVSGLSLLAGEKLYLESWRVAHQGRFLAGKSVPENIIRTNFPTRGGSPTASLLANEILAVLRSPSEATYTAFLTGMSLVLLFLMRNVPALERAYPQLLPAVNALSLAGLSYLFMTLTARLIYPLMAKEKRTSWMLFSSPVTRETILNTKIYFALLVILPSLFLGLIAGYLMRFNQALFISFSLLLTINAATVGLIQLFLGTISPNFSEAENPEAASTSGSGLTAISLSLAFIGINGFWIYLVSLDRMSASASVLAAVVLSAFVLAPLYIAAKKLIYSYDL